MRVLYEICGKKVWKTCKFFWVHFVFLLFYLHSCLGRMVTCQGLRVVQLVLQVVLCDEHKENRKSINKANRYKANVKFKTVAFSLL